MYLSVPIGNFNSYTFFLILKGCYFYFVFCPSYIKKKKRNNIIHNFFNDVACLKKYPRKTVVMVPHTRAGE